MRARPLRIGIIGCGNIGARVHLPSWLAHPEVAEVIALADPAEEALQAARVTAGLSAAQVHRDPFELIARRDVDAVDICTPQYLRRDVLLSSARAGKHILCEKPLATVPADAAAAVATSAEMGTTLAMVHNYLWLPEIQVARQVIAFGEIGEVRAAIVNFLGVVDLPGAAEYRADWRHDAALAGGGVLIDMLHGVYLAEALLGECLQRVSAYVDSREHGASVEDLALCRFETATNAALVNIGWGLGPGGIEVSGSKGRVSIRYENGGTAPWAPLEHVLVSTADGTRVEYSRASSTLDAPWVSDSANGPFERVIVDFAEAVLTGGSATASGEDGQRILEATVGAYASAATGQVVSIPLDRRDPVFQRGVLGVRHLDVRDWSPIRRGSLYGSETDH
jgi:predicted dehydrogenase